MEIVRNVTTHNGVLVCVKFYFWSEWNENDSTSKLGFVHIDHSDDKWANVIIKLMDVYGVLSYEHLTRYKSFIDDIHRFAFLVSEENDPHEADEIGGFQIQDSYKIEI